VDITDDSAFEVLQEALAGRRRVPLNGKSSQVLSVLLQMEVDAQVTPEWFKGWVSSGWRMDGETSFCVRAACWGR
jgi:hypothetical protein